MVVVLNADEALLNATSGNAVLLTAAEAFYSQTAFTTAFKEPPIREHLDIKDNGRKYLIST